jgi:hypothetical protein
MKYQLTTQQIASKVGDDVVILNHSKGAYYGLDDVGTVVWDMLETGPQTLDSLCDAVCEQYEIDREGCEEDIDALLKDLISEKLVETTG